MLVSEVMENESLTTALLDYTLSEGPVCFLFYTSFLSFFLSFFLCFFVSLFLCFFVKII